jgi:hypothetical protein
MEVPMPQATHTASILPEPAAVATQIYVPQQDSCPRREGKTYIPEIPFGRLGKAEVIADIASAEHEEVVIGVDLSAGTSWDASKEIAQAVLELVLRDDDRTPAWCIDFLREQLGVNYVRAAERSGVRLLPQ